MNAPTPADYGSPRPDAVDADEMTQDAVREVAALWERGEDLELLHDLTMEWGYLHEWDPPGNDLGPILVPVWLFENGKELVSIVVPEGETREVANYHRITPRRLIQFGINEHLGDLGPAEAKHVRAYARSWDTSEGEGYGLFWLTGYGAAVHDAEVKEYGGTDRLTRVTTVPG